MKKLSITFRCKLLEVLVDLMPNNKHLAKKLAVGAALLASVSCEESSSSLLNENGNAQSEGLSIVGAEIESLQQVKVIEVSDTILGANSEKWVDSVTYVITDKRDSITQSGVIHKDDFDEHGFYKISLEGSYSRNSAYFLEYGVWDEDDANSKESSYAKYEITIR